jgi:hypothetical protein
MQKSCLERRLPMADKCWCGKSLKWETMVNGEPGESYQVCSTHGEGDAVEEALTDASSLIGMLQKRATDKALGGSFDCSKTLEAIAAARAQRAKEREAPAVALHRCYICGAPCALKEDDCGDQHFVYQSGVDTALSDALRQHQQGRVAEVGPHTKAADERVVEVTGNVSGTAVIRSGHVSARVDGHAASHIFDFFQIPGRYAVTSRRLPAEKVVRPWQLRTKGGVVIRSGEEYVLCAVCHCTSSRSYIACANCGVKFGEPRDLPEESDDETR